MFLFIRRGDGERKLTVPVKSMIKHVLSELHKVRDINASVAVTRDCLLIASSIASKC